MAQTPDYDAADRIAAGRVRHGVGESEDFPGNVCHLVSPIVGLMRLRQRDGEPLDDLGHVIDRLSLVLDMARQEAAAEAQRDAARAELEAVRREERMRAEDQAKAWQKLAKVEQTLNEWGAFDDDGEFAEAIRDSGAWRLARDLRAALADPEAER